MNNKRLQKIEDIKRKKAQSLYYVLFYLMIYVGGCTSVVVQPASAPVPPSEPAPVLTPSPPAITSISQPLAQNGARTIKVKGSGFDNGALVEIYSASGKYIGSGILSGKSHSNQLTVKLPDLKPGKYTVKVKTKDGLFSNATTLTIPKPVPQLQCTGNFSKKPSVLYLGGGDAEKLFERYLTQNSGVEKSLPYSLKIKFYEKKETELVLQTVGLGLNDPMGLEQMFVESRKDFLDKLEKRLKGHVAEHSDTLTDDASKENADYFQCP